MQMKTPMIFASRPKFEHKHGIYSTCSTIATACQAPRSSGLYAEPRHGHIVPNPEGSGVFISTCMRQIVTNAASKSQKRASTSPDPGHGVLDKAYLDDGHDVWI